MLARAHRPAWYTYNMKWLAAFCGDKHGRLVLWQWPNAPLLGWLAFGVAAHVAGAGNVRAGCQGISRAFLFVWAYLELTQGASYFRRTLGLLVLGLLAYGFFARPL